MHGPMTEAEDLRRRANQAQWYGERMASRQDRARLLLYASDLFSQAEEAERVEAHERLRQA